MTIFSGAFTDEQVREQLFSNFAFLTGETRPMSKGTSKNADGITPEMWFKELSWVHCFIFCQAFHEASDRDIINAFEKKACEEVISFMP